MSILNKTIQTLLDEGVITVSQMSDIVSKYERIQKRLAKERRRNEAKEVITIKLAELLSAPGATVKHRKVWEAVGRDQYTRDEVLSSLQSLRTEGVLQNIRMSGNNFQVYWAFVVQPQAPEFSVNGDIQAG